MAKADSPKSNNIPKQNESSKGATSPQGIGVFSSTNKDMQNIEKAAELTATFLVPFILAFALFVTGSVINSVSPLTYSEKVGYFITLTKSIGIPVVFVLLTWLFLVIYYFFERKIPLLLKLSIAFSGISLLTMDYFLIFKYSNFMHPLIEFIIVGGIALGVVVYWCCCCYVFGRISHLKP